MEDSGGAEWLDGHGAKPEVLPKEARRLPLSYAHILSPSIFLDTDLLHQHGRQWRSRVAGLAWSQTGSSPERGAPPAAAVRSLPLVRCCCWSPLPPAQEFLLKGLCHEMNNFFEDHKSQIITFCTCADSF